MQGKQQEKNQMDGGFSVRLLKMLFYIKAINQPTYDKAVKSLKRKEGAQADGGFDNGKATEPCQPHRPNFTAG